MVCLLDYIEFVIIIEHRFCPQCKQFRRAIKKMDIWKLPESLIVHLKRFRQDETSHMRRKNNAMVVCPVKLVVVDL
jgi:ubiquitin C-terminal hydrolase